VKRINLALQGVGVHGASTWGVLDRLLDDERIEIAAISDTSAAALNGAELKAGLVSQGPARATLDALRGEVGGMTPPLFAGWLAASSPPSSFICATLETSPTYLALDAVTRTSSPYGFGGQIDNSLRRVIRQFRFDKVCATEGPALFIGATNVRTGKIRVFSGDAISADAIPAIRFVQNLLATGRMPQGAMKRVLVHIIADDERPWCGDQGDSDHRNPDVAEIGGPLS
jgi:NTE family protein